ncbi:MAG: DUF4091 domain-containing protein [Acidobacteriota bacterium]|nr:DUF4091 domain-containing protein [Acidobacteriota bacterium]
MKLVLAISFALIAAECMAAAATAEVWVVPSDSKVRPDDSPQSRNWIWEQRSKTISIEGAKNEHVPFQLVVSVPPPPPREPAASGFLVSASDLTSPKGRIPSADVKLYFEHEILCPGPSSVIGAGGFWPDALAPLSGPFGMAAEFRKAVKNRVLWIDVVTPPDAPAGDYSGALRITKDGQPIERLALHLKVYDFALSSDTHLIAYMGLFSDRIAELHHVPPSSKQAKELLRNYYAFLYEHRMEPWFNEELRPRIAGDGDEVKLSFDEGAYTLYLDQLKTKKVILEAAPKQLTQDTRFTAFSEAGNKRVKSYLTQVVAYYRAHGWLDRLILNSPIDEPNTAQDFENTRKWASLVHQAAPGVPFLATKTPVPENPAWGTLRGFVNDFSIHGNALNSSAVKQAIREEQAKGGQMSWYISCDQSYPQPNYFIDAPAMDPVMVPWITWRYGMQGILYWDVKFWSMTPDPWVSPVTYPEGYFCSDQHILNGEGSLLYPGSEVEQYTGQRNVNGPVSSIRFELLREGIQDYERLWMLKNLGDGKFADEAVKTMVIDVSAFSRNPADLFELRAKIAQRIQQLTGARH